MSRPKVIGNIEEEFKCPFCEGTLSLGTFALSNNPERKGPAVYHSDPACKKFMDMEPRGFLAEVRQITGKPAPKN